MKQDKDRAMDKMGHEFDHAKDKVGEKADEAKSGLKSAARKVKHGAEDVKDDLAEKKDEWDRERVANESRPE